MTIFLKVTRGVFSKSFQSGELSEKKERKGRESWEMWLPLGVLVEIDVVFSSDNFFLPPLRCFLHRFETLILGGQMEWSNPHFVIVTGRAKKDAMAESGEEWRREITRESGEERRRESKGWGRRNNPDGREAKGENVIKHDVVLGIENDIVYIMCGVKLSKKLVRTTIRRFLCV